MATAARKYSNVLAERIRKPSETLPMHRSVSLANHSKNLSSSNLQGPVIVWLIVLFEKQQQPLTLGDVHCQQFPVQGRV
jgi:hypothetical protein